MATNGQGISFLRSLLGGVKQVFVGGTAVTVPSGASPTTLNFASGATVTYNAATGNWDVAITPATPGAPVGTALGVYGDGSDGAFTCDGTATSAGIFSTTGAAPNLVYTMIRDAYFTNLTIAVGITVHGAGFYPYVSGTATINGSLNVNGANGVTNSGAGAVGGGSSNGSARIGGGGPGGYAGAGVGAWAYSFGGAGGASAFGGAPAVTAPAALYGTPRNLSTLLTGLLSGMSSGSASVHAFFGGNGGFGTAESGSAGAGGAGGGCLVCVFFNLVGSGSISANGGNGSSSTSYAAGGGGGGFLGIITRTSTFAGTMTAAGGLAGPTGTGGSPGAAGTVVTLTA